MPPKKNQKLKKKEDELQKKILSAKERILSKKRLILKIVEKMIEDEVSKEWFLNNCTYLCQADFDDVVQERSIGNLCGYSLCSSLIQQTCKQQYRISQSTNKVYDLTERKSFCSNQCYKASNYVKAQLSPIPLYMRKEEKIKINLLSECNNRGSAGEEIIFHHKIPQEEVYKVFSEETSSNLQNLLNEQVKKCADSLSGLQIKEHSFEKLYVFSDETPNKSDNSALKGENASHSESEFDSDDSVDEKLFPSYDNESALSNRYMPIPEKIKKSVLIPARKSDVRSTPRENELSLDFARKVFTDWMTEDTLKFLIGEKYVYGVKADRLFKTMTESELPNSEKLASIKDEYIKLCLKIDSLPDDDEINDSIEFDLISESNTKSNPQQEETGNNSAKKVFKRRPKSSKDRNKRVTFADMNENTNLKPNQKNKMSPEAKLTAENEQRTKKNVNLQRETQCHPEGDARTIPSKENIICQVEQKAGENTELPDRKENKCEADESVFSNVEAEKEPSQDLPEPEPAFPLVDSISQNMLRKQVLIKKLKSVYTELLPVAGLHYTDIREDVRKFVDSLSLTPSNIIHKPKEWKLISLVLFRMLTRTVLKDIHDELQFAKLCEDPLISFAVDHREVGNLICELVSTENIINIQ